MSLARDLSARQGSNPFYCIDVEPETIILIEKIYQKVVSAFGPAEAPGYRRAGVNLCVSVSSFVEHGGFQHFKLDFDTVFGEVRILSAFPGAPEECGDGRFCCFYEAGRGFSGRGSSWPQKCGETIDRVVAAAAATTTVTSGFKNPYVEYLERVYPFPGLREAVMFPQPVRAIGEP